MSRMLFARIKQPIVQDPLTCCICETERDLTAKCAYCGELVCRAHQRKVQMSKRGIVTMCSGCVSLYDTLVSTTYAGC